MKIILALAFLLLAPLLGGLLAGLDRKITARMQSRFGPPLLQPFYDVFKLFEKERREVRTAPRFFALAFLVFTILSGLIFFSGEDLLLVIFVLSLGGVCLVLGAAATASPFSFIGSKRELLQMMSYEPMVLIAAIGFYLTTGSFKVSEIIAVNQMNILSLPFIFFGFMYILTIKFRKSPFDISTSHHAHQEIVKGLTTEFSGGNLALIEIAHWYENILLLGITFLFFQSNLILGLLAIAAVYFLEILIDNTSARLKWEFMFESAWTITAVVSIANLLFLNFIR